MLEEYYGDFPSPDNPLLLEDVTATMDVSKKVGWLQLTFIAYSFTASGPFGVEAAVKACGPLMAFLALFIVPFLYVIPQILIVTELATMMPSSHGYILWVERAFGPGLGYYNSVTNIVTNLIDSAVFPNLFADYIIAAFIPEAGYWTKVGLGYACIAMGGGVSLLSARMVGHATLILSVLVVLPFLIGTCAGMRYFSWDRVTESKPIYNGGNYDFGLLFSTSLWLFTGWRALGSLGGEVKSPAVFAKGMFTALTLSVLTYMFPLMVAVSVNVPSGAKPWDGGYLAVAFEEILVGLGTTVAVAGCIGMVGLFASCMLMYPRVLWGFADRGWAPKFFTRRDARTGSPYVCVAIHLFFASVLILFDFSVLVRAETFISAIAYVLSATALAVLRKKEPDAPRPFKWPKSFAASVFLVAMPCVIFIGIIGFNATSWAIAGMGAGVNLLVVASYFVARRYRRNAPSAVPKVRPSPSSISMMPMPKTAAIAAVAPPGGTTVAASPPLDSTWCVEEREHSHHEHLNDEATILSASDDIRSRVTATRS